MRVTILGSGTAIPNPDRFPAGYLVAQDQLRCLVDLGPGVLRRAAQAGLDIRDLDAVLLTHYHTDHCADLAALLFALHNPRYAGRKPLALYGAKGLRDLLDKLTAAWRWLEPRDYELQIHEIEPGPFTLGPLEVEAIAVEHTLQSLGYRLTAQDGAIAAFSGDATLCDGLTPLARDADLFVCDSAFPNAVPDQGHMTAGEAGKAAQRAGARRLCLTHFYPECEGHDLCAEARAEFDGEVLMARDLARFELQR